VAWADTHVWIEPKKGKMAGRGYWRAKPDAQKQRLYNAEHAARLKDVTIGHNGMIVAERIRAAQKFVNRVLKRKYVQRKYNTRPIRVEPSQGNGTRYAYAQGLMSTITLPRSGLDWACTEMVLLHEMAHIFHHRMGDTGKSHGWEFASIFLDLVRNVMGKDTADYLLQQYKNFKVRYKKPQRRNLTPAQRKAAAKRAEKARAARTEKKELLAYIKRVGYKPQGKSRGGGWMVGGSDDYKVRVDKDPVRMTAAELRKLKDDYRREQEQRHADKEHRDDPAFRIRQDMLLSAMPNIATNPTSFVTLTGVY
jgi:putative metallohydrolase (TIGR04338 family)